MSSMVGMIPVEIQERILTLLSGRSLYCASQACKLWFSLSAGLAKKRVERFTLPETFLELKQEIMCCISHLWLRLMNYHSLQLQLRENSFSLIGPWPLPSTKVRRGHCSTAVLGCLFYVSCNQEVEVFDAQENFKHLMTLSCENGPIKQIVPSPRLKKILVLSKTLEVYDLPKWQGNEYVMKKIHVIPHNHHNELYKYKSISADDVYIAVQKDEFSITVFYMDHETNNEYFLRFINHTKTTHKIFQFSLWKEELIILLEVGDVLCWPIASPTVTYCGTFQEIRYRNPVWLFKGRIFCSTITSRVLLGLWHLEAGTSYWLMGKPTARLARNYYFDPVIDGTTHEICSVFLKFRILICGTKDGLLIITYLSDSYFNNENHGPFSTLENEFKKKPEFSIKLGDDPIDDIVADFSDDSLYLVLRRKTDVMHIDCFRFYLGGSEMSVEAEFRQGPLAQIPEELPPAMDISDEDSD